MFAANQPASQKQQHMISIMSEMIVQRQRSIKNIHDVTFVTLYSPESTTGMFNVCSLV